MKLVDLSHTIAPGMPAFSPVWPDVEVTPWLSHEQSAASGQYQDCTCEISQVRFVTSLGTYLDSPYHFHPGGASIEALPLEQLVLPGVVVDCHTASPQHPIGPQVLESLDLSGKAVLFHTGWSRLWGLPEYAHHPFLTGETVTILRERGARLVGVDFQVVDDRRDPRRPVHVSLLDAQILIVENLTGLDELPESGFIFHAVPVKVRGAAAFPVRAYAQVEGGGAHPLRESPDHQTPEMPPGSGP